jgi:hypothetical protein
MMFKMGGFKRVLSVGALAPAATTLALGAPRTQARVDVSIGLSAPRRCGTTRRRGSAGRRRALCHGRASIVGGVNLGFGVGHDGWHGDRGWHERSHGRR